MQFGLGVFVGAGASIEGGYSKPLTTGRSQSWGFFFNGGSGPASGAKSIKSELIIGKNPNKKAFFNKRKCCFSISFLFI
jgi:hypothetical protein